MLLTLALLSPVAGQDLFVETRRMLPVLDTAGNPVSLRNAAAGADVTGDGLVDVLIGATGSDYLLVNAGGGLFEDASGSLPSQVADTRVVGLADFDGDGDPDAYLGNRDLPSAIYENVAGTLVHAVDLVELTPSVSTATTGDVDLDGDLDLLVGSLGGVDRLYRNQGVGIAFTLDATALPSTPDDTRDLALGDVDSDGDLDLVATTKSTGAGSLDPNRLLLNDGSGVFQEAPSAGLGVDGTGVLLADLDGDGDLDAYMSGLLPDAVFWGDGAGGFVPGSLFPEPVYSGGSRWLDLGGDGITDLLTSGGGGLRVFQGLGGGTFVETTQADIPNSASPNALVTADFDDDGDTDFMLVSQSTSERLWLNQDGAFGEFQSAIPYVDLVNDITAGDVNGDGFEDAFVGVQGGPNALFLSGGNGTWSDATAQLAPTAFVTRAVELADFDGDGDLDALAGGDAGPAELLLNDGSGTFAELDGAFSDLADRAAYFAVGDVDGDGDLDLAHVENEVFATVRVFQNGGAGTFVFTETLQEPIAFASYDDPHFLDADGDGDLDVLMAGFKGAVYHLGDGIGGFVEVTGTGIAPIESRGLDVGDIDLDGDPDVVIATTSVDELLLNDGLGVFTSGAGYAAVDAFTYDVVLGDIDADGDPDLVTTLLQDGAPVSRLLTNDGAGVLAPSGVFPPALVPVLVDVDADGDLDILGEQDRRPVQLIFVEGGHTTWRTLPRSGKDLRMEVFGAVGTPWFLAASSGTANLPLPPLGTLLLDPGALWLIASGSMPGEGVASVSVPITSDPAFLGQTFFWQSLVGSPLVLTNREQTTITGY